MSVSDIQPVSVSDTQPVSVSYTRPKSVSDTQPVSVSDTLSVSADSDRNCKQCDKVLAQLEHIDDEAGAAGIDFVKIDDQELARQYGVFALPAVVFFRGGSEPVIYAGKG